jgi:hypothetical protein
MDIEIDWDDDGTICAHCGLINCICDIYEEHCCDDEQCECGVDCPCCINAECDCRFKD